MTHKNESQITAYLAGVDYAQSHAPYFRDAPLSGEFSGESMPEIADAYGLSTDEYEVSGTLAYAWADDFEDGYFAHVSTVRNDEELGEGQW